MSFDLFISYAHKDNEGDHAGKVTALVEAIRDDYAKVSKTPLSVFFDSDDIRSMDDWQLRILKGLRDSKMMVAILSPNYFASSYCRKEWEHYVETELAQALPGDGIAPIYVMAHPDYDSGEIAGGLRPWVQDLKRRQYIEWRDFWPNGADALALNDARSRLDALPGQIADRLRRKGARDASPNTVPLPSRQFVGRREEMRDLRERLVKGQIGAITALHGVPGIGKSMLAFAYAWGYGFEYPGGRFLIPAEGLSDLASGLIGLAEHKGVPLSDAERKDPQVALNKVRAAFDSGPAALIVIDNLDDLDLLSAKSIAHALPQSENVHVLVTTRAEPANLPRVHRLAIDTLSTEDALALLHGFRPIPDDEWKAALEVVDRLAGHALAVETVAVYMQETAYLSYTSCAEGLARDGVKFLDREVAPYARGRLSGGDEASLARLMGPILDGLSVMEAKAAAYASCLPPDAVPLPWLKEWLRADFPELEKETVADPIERSLKRLHRLRLLVPIANVEDPSAVSPLGRMHRLVRDIIRARSDNADSTQIAAKVQHHAETRANWIDAHRGHAGSSWELAPLRDICARLIDQGQRQGVVILDRIAPGLIDQGRIQEVGRHWRRAVDLFKGLHVKAPNDENTAMDLAVCQERLGDLALSSGDVEAALGHYEDSLDVRARLGEGGPVGPEIARAVTFSLQKLGDTLRASGDLESAREHYKQALDIRQRLYEEAPDDPVASRDFSISYDRLGDLDRSKGDMTSARHRYEEGLTIAKRLAEAFPENARYARDLAISFNKVGDLASETGDAVSALCFYEEAMRIAKRLWEGAPESVEAARDVWISNKKLGDLTFARGDAVSARRFYDEAKGIAKRLWEGPSESAEFARLVEFSHTDLGDLAHATGDMAGARREYEDALKIAMNLSEGASRSAEFARDVSSIHVRMGDVALAAGESEAAQRSYEAAREISKRLADGAPESAEFARDLSTCRSKLGDLAFAAGDLREARCHYLADLRTARRLWKGSRERVDLGRDLAVALARMAILADVEADCDKGLRWWRRSHAMFTRLKERGVLLSDQDERVLQGMEAKLGLDPT